MKNNKTPFYKEIYYKVESDVSLYNAIIAIGLGLVVSGLYLNYQTTRR